MQLPTANSSVSLLLLALGLAPLVANAGPLSPRRGAAHAARAAASQWTLTSLSRTCDASDATCTWTFGIDTEPGNSGNIPVPCTLQTRAVTDDADGATTPASQAAHAGPATCGQFQVTSGWSGQFGAGNGFTTISISDPAAGTIAWAGYNDMDVGTAGAPVAPDRSFAVQQPRSQ